MTDYDAPGELRDIRAAPFAWIHSDDLRVIGSTIGGKGVAVYMVIASYANNRTQQAWPGVHTICKLTRFSESTVLRLLSQLRAANFLHIEKRPGRTNLYTLLSPLQSTVNGATPEPQSTVTRATPVLSPEQQGTVTRATELDLIEKKVNHSAVSSSSLREEEETALPPVTITAEMMRKLSERFPDWLPMQPGERSKGRRRAYDKLYQAPPHKV